MERRHFLKLAFGLAAGAAALAASAQAAPLDAAAAGTASFPITPMPIPPSRRATKSNACSRRKFAGAGIVAGAIAATGAGTAAAIGVGVAGTGAGAAGTGAGIAAAGTVAGAAVTGKRASEFRRANCKPTEEGDSFMKILAVSVLAIGLGLAAVSASQAMPIAPLDPAQGGVRKRDPGCRRLRAGLASRSLWRMPADVQLSARLAFRVRSAGGASATLVIATSAQRTKKPRASGAFR